MWVIRRYVSVLYHYDWVLVQWTDRGDVYKIATDVTMMLLDNASCLLTELRYIRWVNYNGMGISEWYNRYPILYHHKQANTHTYTHKHTQTHTYCMKDFTRTSHVFHRTHARVCVCVCVYYIYTYMYMFRLSVPIMAHNDHKHTRDRGTHTHTHTQTIYCVRFVMTISGVYSV